jgi:hypothetical protein
MQYVWYLFKSQENHYCGSEGILSGNVISKDEISVDLERTKAIM